VALHNQLIRHGAALKKLLKVLGILALTIVGLLGIVAVHAAVLNERVPLNLLGDGRVYVEQWDKGYVSAKGTWVIDGERSGNPLNVSDITCLRDQNLCYVAEGLELLRTLASLIPILRSENLCAMTA